MLGYLNNMTSAHSFLTTYEYEKLSKAGWRSCIAWPTLLNASFFGTTRLPLSSLASSSKNGFIYQAERRKKSARSLVFVSNSSISSAWMS